MYLNNNCLGKPFAMTEVKFLGQGIVLVSGRMLKHQVVFLFYQYCIRYKLKIFTLVLYGQFRMYNFWISYIS